MKESKGWEFLTAFEEIDEKYIYQAAKPWKENKIKTFKMPLKKVIACAVIVMIVGLGLTHQNEVKAAWEKMTSLIGQILGISEDTGEYIKQIQNKIAKNGVTVSLEEVAVDDENLWIAYSMTDENGNNLSYNETLHRLIGREKINSDERNVLVSHQFYLPSGKNAEDVERMDSEMRTVGNIDEVSADVLGNFDYAALGHIHKPMKVGSELYRYCGTPLACSVSEAQQQKGIIMVEMGVKGEVKTTILPLEPLRQVKVVKGTLEEVLKESCKDYVTVILTDKADLDVIDMQERIRLAFPNLLEIRRENQRKTDYTRTLQTEELLDPYELCCSFLKDLDEEEKMILQDVLHTVQGVK